MRPSPPNRIHLIGTGPGFSQSLSGSSGFGGWFGGQNNTLGNYVVMGWNDLGMHCINPSNINGGMDSVYMNILMTHDYYHGTNGVTSAGPDRVGMKPVTRGIGEFEEVRQR